jgi:hypothetical protein
MRMESNGIRVYSEIEGDANTIAALKYTTKIDPYTGDKYVDTVSIDACSFGTMYDVQLALPANRIYIRDDEFYVNGCGYWFFGNALAHAISGKMVP